jgi:hypothetical protein
MGWLLCRLGFHRWGGSYHYLWVCQRQSCFAERMKPNRDVGPWT